LQPPYEPNAFILEGIMTTLRPEPADAPAHQRVNIAPMGPIVDPGFTHFIFRPYKTATTYQNLKASGEGVFHVTDDACLIARLVCGNMPRVELNHRGTEENEKDRRAEFENVIKLQPTEHVRGLVLVGACRFYELKVTELDDRQDRATIHAQVVHAGWLRDFVGFNRARHAVLEAAILATRLHLTGSGPVLAELDRLQVIVDKTGTEAEHEAMRGLREFVRAFKND
jgi:hypothetical protein